MRHLDSMSFEFGNDHEKLSRHFYELRGCERILPTAVVRPPSAIANPRRAQAESRPPKAPVGS